jgi:hypothetical protein
VTGAFAVAAERNSIIESITPGCFAAGAVFFVGDAGCFVADTVSRDVFFFVVIAELLETCVRW